VRILCFCFLDT